MNVGSLFSGIGGFDLGLERAGFTTAWFCEQNEYCQRVLARHWPGVPIYPDVTQLERKDVEPVDVLCGGFPCQDLSIAGKGAGIDGARSGLWSQYTRLVGEFRPRYVLVENVTALLRNEWLGRVLGDLAALGYDAEWDCIPASAVGAPHQRDRIWLVAYPNGEGPELHESRSGGPRRESARASQSALVQPGEWTGGAEGCWSGGDFAAANPALRWSRSGWRLPSSSEGEGPGHRMDLAPPPEPLLSGMDDGISAALERDRSGAVAALGNALVPQIAEWIGRRIVTYEATQAAVAAPKKEAA